MLSTQQHNHFGLVNLAAPTVGGFSVLCRNGDPGCDSPYASGTASYEAVMLRADFSKFGAGLETLLKQHIKHKSIADIIKQLAADLKGKFRLIEDIMKNSADQVAWEEPLYLLGEQFGKIGDKLGPKKINPKGLADDFEIAGDIFGQFVDMHKVEFNYPNVQLLFQVWRADIVATFGSVSAVLTAAQPKLVNQNLGHLVALNDALIRSMSMALSVPPPVLMNLENVKTINLNTIMPHKKRSAKKALKILLI